MRAVPSGPATQPSQPDPNTAQALADLRAQVQQLAAQSEKLQAELADLQTQNSDLQMQIADLQAQNKELQAQLDAALKGPAGKIPRPALTDITLQLPRNPDSVKTRQTSGIKYLVFNHTALDASVGVEKIASAHQKRWGAILYHYFITGDGAILQTNAHEQVVDLSQPWVAQGINIAVAGNFATEIPNDAQLTAAAQLSAWLLQEYGIPAENIKGASEFINTQSPGLQWQQEKNWKQLLLACIADLSPSVAAAPRPAGAPQPAGLAEALHQSRAEVDRLTRQRDELLGRINGLTEAPAAADQRSEELSKPPVRMDKSKRSASAAAIPPTRPRPLAAPLINDITDELPVHPDKKYAVRVLDTIRYLVIHHSDAPANITPQQIATYHVTSVGWPGIGYHFYIGPDGMIFQVNRLETIAHHAGSSDPVAVGICVAGAFNDATPTPRQIEQAGWLTAWLAQKLMLGPDSVIGHGEAPQAATTCPGRDWLSGKQWKTRLLAHMKAAQEGLAAPAAKTIGHYVLFWQDQDDWAKEEFTAAGKYIARFRPTLGFSMADAKSAEYVTIVGGAAGIPDETEQALVEAGCKVERLAGADFAATKRMLEELALTGRRFRTFNV